MDSAGQVGAMKCIAFEHGRAWDSMGQHGTAWDSMGQHGDSTG